MLVSQPLCKLISHMYTDEKENIIGRKENGIANGRLLEMPLICPFEQHKMKSCEDEVAVNTQHKMKSSEFKGLR